jgi:hypothetical protein
MSKVFRRPMFRKGGGVNMNGIMSGIQDRENYQEGTPSDRQRYEEIVKKYAQPAIDPVSQLLIQGGLKGLSQTGGGGTLANLAMAFEQPTTQLFQNLQQQKNLQRETELAGLEIDLAEEERQRRIQETKEAEERSQQFQRELLGIESAADIKKLEKKYELEEEYGKTGATSSLQKDYSPQRAYEDLVSKRTQSRADLTSFQKPNVEQAFPRATAEYDTYILRNLRTTDNPLGQEIRSNNFGIVPFDQKEGEFDINAMIPGGYYFYPPRKIFVVNDPPTDENEGGLFMVNPYTFEKVRFQGNT